MRAAGITPPEPIGPQHEIEGFDCGEGRLNELLQRSATLAGAKSPFGFEGPQAQTFVAAADRRVVAFYTARFGSLSPAGGPASDTVHVTIVPHFAVDRRWQDGRIAADLLWHLVRHAYTTAPATGSRALFGYAINRRVKRLYMRLGARPLPHLIHPLATMISFADVSGAIRDPTECNRVNDQAGYGMNTLVVRNDDAVQAEADGRIVAFNIEKGICYEFNTIGARVWSIIAQPTRVAALCDRLTAEFDVDRETCEREVLELLGELQSKRLIVSLQQGALTGA